MANRALLGRVLMSVTTATAAFLPLTIDLGHTHALNPAWPPHARLHGVWLLATGCLVGLVALYLIWFYQNNRALGVTLASVLTSCVLGGFFLAAATATFYGGSLGDPDSASSMANHDMTLGIPPNLLIFGLAFMLLIRGTMLAWGATRGKTASGG